MEKSESLENAAGSNHTPATHFGIFRNLRLSHDSWCGVYADNLGSGHLAHGKGSFLRIAKDLCVVRVESV